MVTSRGKGIRNAKRGPWYCLVCGSKWYAVAAKYCPQMSCRSKRIRRVT